MDRKALETLADEFFGVRAKGFPQDAEFGTVRELRSVRPSLFSGGFMTPIATLRNEALSNNFRRMAEFCRAHDVDIAPHGKTTMAPQLFERQLSAGAWAITVATPWQAQVCRAFGVHRVLLANELVDPAGIAWVTDQQDADEQFEFLSYVDSPGAVDLAAGVLAQRGATRPLDVLVEVGVAGGRTGCRDERAVDEVVTAVQRSRFHRLLGVASYEGLIGKDASAEVMREVRQFLGRQRRTAERLAAADAFDGSGPIVLTAGGSQFFDVVVEELSGNIGTRPVQIVVRSGSYAIHDERLYAEVSPFQRHPEYGGPLEAAVEVWTRVLSRPEPTLALLDAGRRDLPADSGMPVPRRARRAGFVDILGSDWSVRDMNDQHAYLVLPADQELAPGDLVSVGISHPCTLFDKWTWLPVVTEDGTVIDAVRTYF